MIYFDNAATSYPKPEEVYIAIEKSIRHGYGNPGRSNIRSFSNEDLVSETRQLLANLINASDYNEIVFTGNATDSLNMAIKGFLKKNDHVITTSIEHNSVIRPLKQMEQEGFISLSIVQADIFGNINPDDIRKQITEKTSLIVTTHVSNVIGTIVPIEAIGRIAKENHITFLVDCSQSIGVLDIDVKKMNIGLLAFPGHKNLFGPTGIGGLYIMKGIEITPLRYGGTGNLSDSLLQPKELPYRYESGTLNMVGIAGLNAGVKFIMNTGIERIRNQEMALMHSLLRGLNGIDDIEIYGINAGINRTAVVSINIKGKKPSEVGFDLVNIFDIVTRTGLQCSPLTHNTIGTGKIGTIRLSPGYFNTENEVEQVIEALKQIAEN